jgi:hypothetical protein
MKAGTLCIEDKKYNVFFFDGKLLTSLSWARFTNPEICRAMGKEPNEIYTRLVMLFNTMRVDAQSAINLPLLEKKLNIKYTSNQKEPLFLLINFYFLRNLTEKLRELPNDSSRAPYILEYLWKKIEELNKPFMFLLVPFDIPTKAIISIHRRIFEEFDYLVGETLGTNF